MKPQTERVVWLVLLGSGMLFLAALVGGCGPEAAAGCRADSDCNGQVCISGRCTSIVGSTDDATTAAMDLSTVHVPSDGSADGPAAFCNFNGNGVIEASEEPVAIGLGGLYAMNPDGTAVAVSVAKTGSGWDFSAPVSNERKVFDQILDPTSQWWAADFPTATFAQRLSETQPIYGVFRATPTGLQLLGAVSDQNGVTKTELTYATPIDTIRYPMAEGDSWTSASNVTGVASGVAVAFSETYVFKVDARGTTKVPAGSFDTLRLRMSYSQTIGLQTTTRIVYLHMAECAGAVARVRSQDNETSNDFTMAAEYRRVAAP